ncbi:MAG: hypothetical protein GX589_00370 [Deltaproteobacteria bacterium]|nr:hypothetical protein [Deltaproteobacteria bacterium]
MGRLVLSGEELPLTAIADHHNDLKMALYSYYDPLSPSSMSRFATYTSDEVRQERDERLDELERASMLNVFGSLEAVFQIDFHQRCEHRKKDALSKAFCELRKHLGQKRVVLDEHIFKTWKKHAPNWNRYIGELNGAFNMRNWLAHGRYFEPALGKKYNYEDIYVLAERVLKSLPFLYTGNVSTDSVTS